VSHLTQTEIDALNSSTLPRKTAFLIRHVSSSMFSIARHYGGATVDGATYLYLPVTDELIRHDVMKWLAKQRKAAKREHAGPVLCGDEISGIREEVKP